MAENHAFFSEGDRGGKDYLFDLFHAFVRYGTNDFCEMGC
jgi:hypothetical protein